MRKSLKIAFLGLSVGILAACGGGDGGVVSKTINGYTVDGGVAQKGALLKGSHVWIDELNPFTYAPTGFTYDLLTKDNQGRFDSSTINFTRPQIQTFAEGYYFNEITGTLANDSVLLQAQGDLTIDRLVNVNLLTTLAGPRLVALATDKTKRSTYRKFAAARTQAQKEVLAAFWIYNSTDLLPGGVDSTKKLVPANFSELDLSSSQSANQILAALSALAVKTGGNGVGISQFIANFQLDLADDGLINGSGGSTSVRGLIDSASATAGIMTTVAANINSFYGANTITSAQLSPWLDSSGGADQVIDKFKYTGTGVVGSETQSGGYTVGADDIGQCVWASSGKLYRNGTAVTAAAMAAPNDVFKIGLTGAAAGAASGFIQRSAPLSAGGCPSSQPSSGLTRIAKYTAQLSVTVGGTVSGLGTGVQVTLKNNGSDALVVSGSGAFTFATPLAANAAYNVTVGTQPLGQTCTLANASGTTGMVNVSNIAVTCTSNSAWTVSTLAGNGQKGNVDGQGTAAVIRPNGIVVGKDGNIYVAQGDWTGWQSVRRVSTSGAVTTLTGKSTNGSANGPCALASFSFPIGIGEDAQGALYIGDFLNHKVRKITADCTVTTYAGTGASGSADGPSTSATFVNPKHLTVAPNGDVYVADDTASLIRKISTTGQVTTFAGDGTYVAKDGVGTKAGFGSPSGLTTDLDGNLYVADCGANKIRKITADGTVTTIAGSGVGGSLDGPALTSTLSCPVKIVFDKLSGGFYFSQSNGYLLNGGGSVRMLKNGIVTTIAGVASNGTPNAVGTDNGLGNVASFGNHLDLALDSLGNIYVGDAYSNLLRKISPNNKTGLLYVWYAYSGDTPVAYEAWANDSLNYLHTSANRTFWASEVNTTDIKAATQITRTASGSTISIARGTMLRGMKVDITVTGFVVPWSTVMFNYYCSDTTCTVSEAWSETSGVAVNVKLTQ
ncbi:MAG: hypothetical protein QE283_11120 [Rhodoferax sp.]|nr:hypothetical protein [Rhodoferax sp.]